MTSPLACGIDFGTSNSTVGLASSTGARLAPLEGEARTMPSAIFFPFATGVPVFGRAAISAYVEGHDGRLMRALKSILGSALIHEKTTIGRDRLSFTAIIERFFRILKQRAEETSGSVLTAAVLGRPVRFVDDDDKADMAAQNTLEAIARAAGISHIGFQYEPIAAALDYEQHLRQEDLVLIVDIGGGTSDFSLIRVSPERAKKAERKDDILGNAGVHIGGTDFDRLLSLRTVMPHFGFRTRTQDGKRELPSRYFHDLATWHRINFLYTPAILRDLREVRYEAAKPQLVERFIRTVEDQRGHDIALEVERGKIALTDADETQLQLADRAEPLMITVTRRDFDAAINDSIARVKTTIGTLLKEAGLQADGVKTIFMTGGSAAVPLLRHSITAALPHAKLVRGDPLGSVGTGLALDAWRRFGG